MRRTTGVATFLIGDGGVVSWLRFQVSQEIAPDGDSFDMWGSAPLACQPESVPGLDALRASLGELRTTGRGGPASSTAQSSSSSKAENSVPLISTTS